MDNGFNLKKYKDFSKRFQELNDLIERYENLEKSIQLVTDCKHNVYINKGSTLDSVYKPTHIDCNMQDFRRFLQRQKDETEKRLRDFNIKELL